VSGRTPGRLRPSLPPPPPAGDLLPPRRHPLPVLPLRRCCLQRPGQPPVQQYGVRLAGGLQQVGRQRVPASATAAGPSGHRLLAVWGHHGAAPGTGVPAAWLSGIRGRTEDGCACADACVRMETGTSCAVQRMPAIRGMDSFRRDCWGRGSRWASFSRSMVRPRWIRERTVPSFTPSASATSS